MFNYKEFLQKEIENLKETYLKQIININENTITKLLTEKKADLDRYTINLAHDLLQELKGALISYELNQFKNTENIIKDKGGRLYFKPKEIHTSLPYIFLDQRTPNVPGEYFPKLNALLLHILDDNFIIDNTTKALLNTNGMENTLAHELAHYISDSRRIASGKSLNFIKNNNQTTYNNDPEELNSITKELEMDCMRDLDYALKTIFPFLSVDDQKEYFKEALTDILKDCKNNNQNRFYNFLNNLTPKNLNKVYKDVYNYCLDEYLKNKMIYDDTAAMIKKRKRIHNSDFYHKWLSDHKF